MVKSKFGTKEVIIAIVLIIVYVLLEGLQRYMVARGILTVESYDWVKARVVIIAIAAALLGPAMGCVIGISGALLANMIFYGYASYVEILAYALAAYIIGRYAKQFKIWEGEFKGRVILDFNVVQILSNVICSIFVCPLLFFVGEDMNLLQAANLGAKSAFGSSVSIAIVGTFVLWIFSKRCSKRV